MTAERLRGLAPFAAAVALLLLCCQATWFLCDDAFIAFRYVGNAHDGHGLVWNRAPFAPVEGYSCFLWVLVLQAVWAVAGIAPPESANWLAVGCAVLTLLLVARRLAIAPLPERLRRHRAWLAALVLLGIAGNHTFVTWATSGLETAMFGLFAVAWTLRALRTQWRARDLAGLAALAALAQLTRPDGALLVLATLAIAGQRLLRRGLPVRGVLLGLLPLLLPALHLLWRRSYYGEWLPNTYYAKVVSAWPESGLRYLYCFVVEHGLWLWLPLALAWGIAALRRGGAVRLLLGERFPAAAAVATWIGLVAYYTLVVGGDHFAFRPFAHLLPLVFLAALAMAAALGCRARPLLLCLLLFGVAANAFGWWYDAALRGREKDGFVRASAALPQPLAGLFAGWDRHRAWLRLHYVALPRGLHAATCDDLLRVLPLRREGQVEGLEPGQRAVFRTVAAGVVAWSLPDVAMLDAAGLNDWIVARHAAPPAAAVLDGAALRPLFPGFDTDRDGRLDAGEIAAAARSARFSEHTGVLVADSAWGDLLLAVCDRDGDGLDQDEFVAAIGELGDRRHMAHERTPPPGYFEALRPNVAFDGARFRAVPGVPPLTDAEVRAVEAEFRARVVR